MQILTNDQIRIKIKRIAIQILEKHLEHEIYLAGINNKGFLIAQLIEETLLQMGHSANTVFRVRLNPAEPLSEAVQIDLPLDSFNNKHIILTDDVGNTGRTLFYAMKPLMDVVPASIECAVLIDRKHKAFPVRVDYVGLSLATTYMEHIEVDLKDLKKMSAHLN
jgi:pyrimidine operon attenuation protein / uracil phosphoribosyltransferase